MTLPIGFTRHPSNPILKRRDMPLPVASVMNPGAAEVKGRVVLLVRAEDRRGISSLWVAWSEDGVGGWEVARQPLLYPEHDWEAWGCEDPRISWLDELGEWVIVYTAYSSAGPAVALARTADFRQATKVGLILSPNNKDAALFPRRFDGAWCLVHRPMLGQTADIWLARSPDLVHWGKPEVILKSRGDVWWDGTKVGIGPPPIEVPQGWLMVYHGVKEMASGPIYRVGLALVERDDPSRVLARSEEWVFGPGEEYEYAGDVPNVVFPCGAFLRGRELWMYYGAADTRICLATAPLDELMKTLRRAPHAEELPGRAGPPFIVSG